jgi:hypothetical protein
MEADFQHPLHQLKKYEKITLMFEKAYLKTAIPQRNFASQNCADSCQQATGNRQQATGNRQQATGNRQQAIIHIF